MPDQIRPDTDHALRIVGEEIAVRLLLAHCIATSALTTPDPKETLQQGKAELLAQIRKLGDLAGDANDVVPTVCEAVITSVFNTASQRLK